MAEDAPTAASSASTPVSAPPRPSGARGAVWIVLALALVGAAVGVTLYQRRQKPPPRQAPPVTISTTNAVRGDMDVTDIAIGTVTPIYTAWISPRVDGQLLRVNYTEGQMVKTNDLLAEIDPEPYQAQLAVAQGQLARDKAQLEGARVDLDRFQSAYAKSIGTNVLHAISKQTVDDQLALVHQYEGTVKLDEGQVANAQVQLAYCFIHAPINGRTGLRLIDPGNVVHAANTNALVVIAQLQPITVVFTVDEQFLPAIQRQLQAGHNMTVEAYNADFTQKLATGTFLSMDAMIDIATRTIRIKALFDNGDLMLFPNSFVNAKLIIDTLRNVTLVPSSAIQRNAQQGAFVYVVTPDQKVKMQGITPGVEDKEADTTSVQGLEAGTVVATDNFNKLGDGMKVNLRQPPGEGPKGGAPGNGKPRPNKSQADAP